MPSYINPQGNWQQFLISFQQMQRDLTAAQQQLSSIQNQVDQYGNTVTLVGNLNPLIMIGATATQIGVQIGTGLASTPGQPTTPGIAVVQGTFTTTITTTANSPTATVASASGLSNNMMIGAIQLGGNPVIVPGTFIKNLVGTTVTLSINAAQSSSSIYCAAAFVRALTGFTYP